MIIANEEKNPVARCLTRSENKYNFVFIHNLGKYTIYFNGLYTCIRIEWWKRGYDYDWFFYQIIQW